jgi:hypothetical protein
MNVVRLSKRILIGGLEDPEIVQVEIKVTIMEGLLLWHACALMNYQILMNYT